MLLPVLLPFYFTVDAYYLRLITHHILFPAYFVLTMRAIVYLPPYYLGPQGSVPLQPAVLQWPGAV